MSMKGGTMPGVTRDDEQPDTNMGPDGPDQQRGGRRPARGDLRRLTVNLVPRAVISLNYATEVTGDNDTDTVNRALQLYAYITKVSEDGGLVFIEHPATGLRERLILL